MRIPVASLASASSVVEETRSAASSSRARVNAFSSGGAQARRPPLLLEGGSFAAVADRAPSTFGGRTRGHTDANTRVSMASSGNRTSSHRPVHDRATSAAARHLLPCRRRHQQRVGNAFARHPRRVLRRRQQFAVPHNKGMDVGPSQGIGGRVRGDARMEGLHRAAFGRRAHQRRRWDSGRVRRRCERKGWRRTRRRTG